MDGLWIGAQEVDGKVYLICTMGDELTNHSITNSKLTLIRYLSHANIVNLQPMGDGMTTKSHIYNRAIVYKMWSVSPYIQQKQR